mmetsp:Transcript_5677/g.10272  ORF Transcript_5677/g.10272 Transcript_5677/m.10272 type:complete len:290 (-) Transcript_5677:989-1858(-)
MLVALSELLFVPLTRRSSPSSSGKMPAVPALGITIVIFEALASSSESAALRRRYKLLSLRVLRLAPPSLLKQPIPNLVVEESRVTFCSPRSWAPSSATVIPTAQPSGKNSATPPAAAGRATAGLAYPFALASASAGVENAAPAVFATPTLLIAVLRLSVTSSAAFSPTNCPKAWAFIKLSTTSLIPANALLLPVVLVPFRLGVIKLLTLPPRFFAVFLSTPPFPRRPSLTPVMTPVAAPLASSSNSSGFPTREPTLEACWLIASGDASCIVVTVPRVLSMFFLLSMRAS